MWSALRVGSMPPAIRRVPRLSIRASDPSSTSARSCSLSRSTWPVSGWGGRFNSTLNWPSSCCISVRSKGCRTASLTSRGRPSGSTRSSSTSMPMVSSWPANQPASTICRNTDTERVSRRRTSSPCPRTNADASMRSPTGLPSLPQTRPSVACAGIPNSQTRRHRGGWRLGPRIGCGRPRKASTYATPAR